MLSVKGIYDGGKICLIEEVKVKGPRKVIVTFVEESEEVLQQAIYTVADKGTTFSFLKEPEEDIYTDKDLRVRYA